MHSILMYFDWGEHPLERSGILGISKEPIGFSGLDVQKVRRHPKWDEVKFCVNENVTSVTVCLVNKFGL
ncbi:MAG: hypothetical protein HUU08_14530 [Candidatus Brocadia sp.]|nr:hypothetical protein [Candidatus Brocadia sp.]